MVKSIRNNFMCIINNTTGEEIYRIQFNYGTQKIVITEKSKITLDFVHGGFRQAFSRVGDDLIIGSDLYVYMLQPLGIGYGKEIWSVSENEENAYNITIYKYSWEGQDYGYSDMPRKIETITMTADELITFQSEHMVNVKVGMNTLYTTWPVLPNPIINYHMEDKGFYSPANGKLILKDYFKYGKETVFVGDKLLSDIIKNNENYESLINTNHKKIYDIYDTFFDENLYGGEYADKIRSYKGDDVIYAEQGNDKIYLGEGNKTIVINEYDGKDIIYNFEKADSVNFKVDTDNVYFTKSKNDLILNRDYFNKTEKTVIKNYFKNYTKDNKIVISNGDNELLSDFTKGWTDEGAFLKVTGNKIIKGTQYNDEAYSSKKNETFILGKGNNIIHFENDGNLGWYPYRFGNDTIKLTTGEKVTLDFKNTGGNLSFERKGNDCIIKSRHQIEICGRDTGKEEWIVKKNGKDSYTIVKTKYHFTGSGFSSFSKPVTETVSAAEFKEFQTKNNVKLKIGKNTLYTSWAVVPNPEIHYSMKDSSNWGTFLGSVTLKNYFKLNEDNVYIGDKSLREYLKNINGLNYIDMSKSRISQYIEDTYMSETIIGSGFDDKIISDFANDIIEGGKGDDFITLGEGNKIIKINQGDGKDIISIGEYNSSVNIIFDEEVDGLSFRKSGNNLIIKRNYENEYEETMLRGFYKDNIDCNIKISVGDEVIFNKLDKDITNQTWQEICKYPPIETLIAESAEPVWQLICGYPPCDVVESVDIAQINQDISAWQTDLGGISDIIDTVMNTDNMPVLVQAQ